MKEHKYAELAEKLRSEIESGKYAQGDRLPSENELAAQTGYSRQTVRQAMSILESAGLTDRVQGSGTYVRGIQPHREVSHNIGVITTYIGEYIFPTILHGIDHVLAQNGYTNMLAATRNRVDKERQILTEFLQKPIDGLIVEGTKTALPNPNVDLYARFAQEGIPVVFINGYYPDLSPKPVYVVADDRAGGRMACEALLHEGRHRIAGIFKSDDIQGHRRYAGYAQALQDAGLAVSDDSVLWYTTENREELLHACGETVLSGCDGVVCYNDEIALRVLRMLNRDRPVVPREVMIASFDNSTYAQLSAVPYLSLTNPKEQIGRLAAEKLLGLLAGKPQASTILPWSVE